MKKLFTLSIAIFCAVAINAQFNQSGNGFEETFTYDNGYTYVEGSYGEVGCEWFEGAVIEDGKLKWDVPAEGESWFGMWEVAMDLSSNPSISFKYAFPADGNFGIWIEDAAGGGGEVFPSDFNLGLSDMLEYTIDLNLEEYAEVDLTQIVEVWIGSESVAGGTFYLDDLKIGEGTTGIEMKKINDLSIYPNPVTSEFSIGDNAESVSIFNITGQKVFSLQNYQKGSLIDVSELKDGIYLVVADDRTNKMMVR